MASSISALSLFILVLISGCFTLPLNEIHFPSLSQSSFENDLATEENFNSRVVFGDVFYTTSSEGLKRSLEEHVGSDISAVTVESEPKINNERPERMAEEHVTEETFTFMPTSDESLKQKRHEELQMFTVEPTIDTERSERIAEEHVTEETFTFMPTSDELLKQKREEELQTFTVEPTMNNERSERMTDELVTEETFTFMPTSEEPMIQKRIMEESSIKTVEETTGQLHTVTEDNKMEYHHKHGEKRPIESEFPTTQSTHEFDGKKMKSEFTTSSMSLFTSTSSAIAPELYTPESTDFSSIQTSTQKYVGSLVDHEEEEDTEDLHKDDSEHKTYKEEEDRDNKYKQGKKEEEHEPTIQEENEISHDSKKKLPKLTEKDSGESKEEKYVTGILYDKDLKSVPSTYNRIAILDESDGVTKKKTESSKKITTFTESKKLDQGKEPSQN